MNTSRKLLLAGATALAATVVASAAFAQASATGTGDASVTVIQPLTVVDTHDLSFGRVTTSGTSGTVTVSEGGVRGTDGGVTPAAGTVSAGLFTFNGEPNQAVTVTLVSGALNLVGNASASNTLTGTVASSVATTGGASKTLGAAGTGTGATFGTLAVPISGTLTIPVNATSDTYHGSYQVTVAYN
ncbi:MAG TPA: DUF4402 domain-containing protein [Phenylobacterium sp.]|jgi:hypothetical protein|nr:DUF4402 domain-containing protein [Phenylobacterium sp.]